MEIEVHRVPHCVVLRVGSDMRIWGKPEQERLLQTVRAEGELPGHLVFNMSKVHHLDTAGIGQLVRVVIECTKRGIVLRMVMPSGIPGQALARLHIFDAWQTFPDEDAALQAVRAAAA